MTTTLTARPLTLALASATVLAFALLSALFAPRGPVTASQALTTMVAALAVGVIVAATTGQRWVLVLAPAAFVAVFELARMGAWGPTVRRAEGVLVRVVSDGAPVPEAEPVAATLEDAYLHAVAAASVGAA